MAAQATDWLSQFLSVMQVHSHEIWHHTIQDILISLSWALGACSNTKIDETQPIIDSLSKECRQRAVLMKQDAS